MNNHTKFKLNWLRTQKIQFKLFDTSYLSKSLEKVWQVKLNEWAYHVLHLQ